MVQLHAYPLLRGGTGWPDTCSGTRSLGVAGLGSGPPSLPLLHAAPRIGRGWPVSLGSRVVPGGTGRWLGLEGVGGPGCFSYGVPRMVPESSPAKLNAEVGGFLHETEMGTWAGRRSAV